MLKVIAPVALLGAALFFTIYQTQDPNFTVDPGRTVTPTVDAEGLNLEPQQVSLEGLPPGRYRIGESDGSAGTEVIEFYFDGKEVRRVASLRGAWIPDDAYYLELGPEVDTSIFSREAIPSFSRRTPVRVWPERPPID